MGNVSGDDDVAKGEKGVTEYFCKKCLASVAPSARRCYKCGHDNIETHTREDYGAKTNISEISARVSIGTHEYKLH